MKYLLLPLFLLLSSSLLAQSGLEQSLKKYSLDYLPEKVFVHTDKNIYAAGETIWVAVYLSHGQTHLPGTVSSLVYVELHDANSKMIIRQKLYSEDGYLAGEIDLPAEMLPGDYQLTAYTNYQRNSGDETLFRKTIRILPGLMETVVASAAIPAPSKTPYSINNDINLRFFPEGGDCILGVPCRLAVVAEDASGQPLAVSGALRDENDRVATIFRTNEFGIGKLTYQPEEGKSFQAVLDKSARAFDIPAALKQGYNLSIRRPEGAVRVLVKTNRAKGLKGARILLHRRGVHLFDKVFDEEEAVANLKFFVEDLPEGVLVATLFDYGGQAVAERLFFVAPDKESTRLQIETDSTLGLRQAGKLQVHMPIWGVETDSMATGQISLSIIPSESGGGPASDDIRTWLMLNSDIDRPIPFAPELLFASNERDRDNRMDEFLLTRGWRRFRWEAILKDSVAFMPEYLVEQGVYLRGQMGKFEKPKKPRPGKVFLLQLNSGYFEEKMTDERANFIFGPFIFHDTIDVFLQGRFRSGKKNQLNPDISLKDNSYVKLGISENASPKLPALFYPKRANESKEPAINYQELSRQMLTVARNYDSLIIHLDVLEVKASKILTVDEERDRRGAIYGGRADTRLVLDSMPGGNTALSVLDLLRQVPGVQVTGPPHQETVLIRGITSLSGSNVPLFLLDGVPVEMDVFYHYPVHDVEFIDVLKGPSAAAYGSRGANGVVLVYTRRVYNQKERPRPSPGLLKTKIFGFHKAREFAVFDPTLPGNKNRPDVRTTLHWNPKLITDEFGIAKDTFTTSDQIGKFIIIAQGLRKDGRPFYGTTEFVVEEK